MEIWKNIDGYNGLYQVSNKGNVRRYKAQKWCVLIPWNSGKGYHMVSLSLNGVRKVQLVHRLVLSAFISVEPGMHANHKNEIKNDNRLENLEWVTPSENANYGGRNKRIGAATYSRRVYRYLQLSSNGELIKTHESKSILEKNGFAPSHVRNACKNGIKYKGFFWKREKITN